MSKARVKRPGFFARKVADAVSEATRAGSREAGAAYESSMRATQAAFDDSAARAMQDAYRKGRRLAVVGGASLGAGLSAPVVVHHGFRSRERRKAAVNVAKGRYVPSKEETKARARAILKDPAYWGLTGGAVAGSVGGILTAGVAANRRGPLTARRFPENMTILEDRGGAYRPTSFANPRKLTGKGKLALAAGGLVAASLASDVARGRRAHEVANRAAVAAGYPKRGYWTNRQVEKAWKGEQGDKRNTKYYLAGATGAGIAGAAIERTPSARRVRNLARVRSTEAFRNATESPFKAGMKAAISTPGMNRLTVGGTAARLGGAAVGAGLYGTYRRNKKMSRDLVVASKAMRDLEEFSKAMSPNKLVALRRAANRSTGGSSMARGPATTIRRDGDYARNRLDVARVGRGANVGPSFRDRFVSAARSQTSSAKYAATNAGASAQRWSPVPAMGNPSYSQTLAARRGRLSDPYRQRPNLP